MKSPVHRLFAHIPALRHKVRHFAEDNIHWLCICVALTMLSLIYGYTQGNSPERAGTVASAAARTLENGYHYAEEGLARLRELVPQYLEGSGEAEEEAELLREICRTTSVLLYKSSGEAMESIVSELEGWEAGYQMPISECADLVSALQASAFQLYQAASTGQPEPAAARDFFERVWRVGFHSGEAETWLEISDLERELSQEEEQLRDELKDIFRGYIGFGLS